MAIALNLCPFARRVFEAHRIRCAVSGARDEVRLLKDPGSELKTPGSFPTPNAETTLLIHPRMLADFLDDNDFLGAGERLVGDLGPRGAVQIASFRPTTALRGPTPARWKISSTDLPTRCCICSAR